MMIIVSFRSCKARHCYTQNIESSRDGSETKSCSPQSQPCRSDDYLQILETSDYNFMPVRCLIAVLNIISYIYLQSYFDNDRQYLQGNHAYYCLSMRLEITGVNNSQTV